ncbi:hypothetical protein D7Y07_18500 [Bacteroides acidifaciens]|uniref:Uncharacterized protein n=1 Tax=Bacteroides acidifaciens TaxID=85831 RepID=A0A3L7YXF5_9BACE|nr:hypothetical protein D7Y07_18500 [Bacteroides acidifaciens]
MQLNGLFGTLTKIAEVFHPSEKLPLLYDRYNIVRFRQKTFILRLLLLPESKEFSCPVCERRFL